MRVSKVLVAVLTAGLVSAFAMGGDMQKCGNQKGSMEKGGMGKGCGDTKKMQGCDSKMELGNSHGFMGVFMSRIQTLALSKEQDLAIKKLMVENKPNFSNPADAFVGDKFDAEKYMQIMQNKKQDMLKHQADIISKVYAVLTSEQKTQLKNDLAKDPMLMKGKCDKGASNRR